MPQRSQNLPYDNEPYNCISMLAMNTSAPIYPIILYKQLTIMSIANKPTPDQTHEQLLWTREDVPFQSDNNCS